MRKKKKPSNVKMLSALCDKKRRKLLKCIDKKINWKIKNLSGIAVSIILRRIPRHNPPTTNQSPM